MAIKLDFLGLIYIEKYKDKSSEEYKKVADEKKEQVKAPVNLSLYLHEVKYTETDLRISKQEQY